MKGKHTYTPELRSIPLTHYDCEYRLQSFWWKIYTKTGFSETILHTSIKPVCQHKNFPFVIRNNQKDPLYCDVAVQCGKCPNRFSQ